MNRDPSNAARCNECGEVWGGEGPTCYACRAQRVEARLRRVERVLATLHPELYALIKGTER